MDKRVKLQLELEEFDNVTMVKFQPPPSIMLTYPCIVYNLQRVYTRHADNYPYIGKDQYTITVIDPDPDSQIAKEIIKHFRYASFDRRFVADNLYHDVVTLYY